MYLNSTREHEVDQGFVGGGQGAANPYLCIV